MYGCYDAMLFYGFNEGNRDEIIDYYWLYDNCPGIEIAALDVVKNYCGEACYGICVTLDETGKSCTSQLCNIPSSRGTVLASSVNCWHS